MILPNFLEPYQLDAEESIAKGCVSDIRFDIGVYQVCIVDGNEEFWPFLRFDDNDALIETFCSCSSDESPCVHIATAYLYIFGVNDSPLHHRFEQSLWNAIFLRLFIANGTASFKEVSSGHYIIENGGFSINATAPSAQETLESMLINRHKETEYNSLKFFSITPKDLSLWHQGRPSFALRYKLSPWTDIAMMLMAYQNSGKDYMLSFITDDTKMITGLEIKTAEIMVSCSLSAEDLIAIIPSLTTVSSPLQVYSYGEEFIATISYNTTSSSFTITSDESSLRHYREHQRKFRDIPEEQRITIGPWEYVPEVGFFSEEKHPLLDRGEIPAADVEAFFEEYYHIIEHKGVDITVHGEEPPISYDLFFDEDWNFHVVPYLFVVGDLQTGSSHVFGRWVFCEGHGFYKIAPSRFPASPTIISRDAISAFVDANKSWLNTHEGFHTHLSEVHDAIGYEVTDKRLIFSARSDSDDVGVCDFGQWVFIRGSGFYAKTPSHQSTTIRPGIVITRKKVPSFIKENLEECEGVAGFFAEKSPYKSIGLTISYGDDGVVIAPEYSLAEEFSGAEVLIFGEYLYVAGAGFYKTPQEDMLPEKFRHRRVIDVAKERYRWLYDIVAENITRGSIAMPTVKIKKVGFFDDEEKSFDIFGDGAAEKDYDLTGLNSSLRHYQEDGIQWLWSLYSYGLSGLLCDDMGLGKTHQAMALFAAVKNKNRGEASFLVVCPTSVIYHWEDKIRQFLPGMSVAIYHGPDREDVCRVVENNDIVVTSYGIARGDIEHLSSEFFDVAIFDEIQVAKNHNSKVHKALLKIPSTMAVGLTGTPIENNLMELKALFDIVLPNYMPSKKKFRNLFIKPMEKGDSAISKALLKKLVKPFLLRRKKEKVLAELPAKTEEIEYCSMLPKQRDLYYSELEKKRMALISDLEDTSKAVPYVHIFTLLSHLKQICNHPAAFLGDVKHYKKYESGKWDLFVEILRQARDSGKKVVVFSQYLSMLDIIERHLRDEGVHYAAVRGSTGRRAEEIFRFHNDSTCEVFVGSLRAVGLGIDLTAASVVIHYDRWWSAAREDQATDRVHRIGQKLGVQVFKFITKDSFEERIHSLITAKEKLMEEIVDAHDDGSLHKFSRTELIELLKYT
ncbi:MAG: DEAD/DEAH box helicase [Waddliaceae bacterium]|nr:DEAD/DEAH box helicase [Waddliaceae bacterium]